MDIYAHRGSSGNCPENTMSAFQAAAALPITGVELDVQLTKDDVAVVIHDEKINRTSTGNGYVKDLTFEQLRTYDFGIWFGKAFRDERIPSLSEVLDLFSETNQIVNIELKTNIVRYEGIEEIVLRLVHDKNMENQIIISSFNHDSILTVKELAPYIQTAALSMREFPDSFHYLHGIEADALHISERAMRKPSIRKLIAQGFPVRVFTVNKVRRAGLFKKMGVEAVITDFPGKMIKYF